jgi:nuclear GTP-binding protein
VPQNHHDSPEQLLLRGVVRVERVEHPEQYIPAVLKRVKKHHMAKTYEISDWNDDHILFLELLARKGGRLLKGGEPDVDGVAKMVLNDFSKWSRKLDGQETRLLTSISARTNSLVFATTSRRG